MDQINAHSFLVLCVDAVENGIPKGRYYCSDLSQEYEFHNADQFLLEADELLNNLGRVDTFGVCKNAPVRLNGKIATFRIRVLFRRHADWQGSVMWLETRHEENFRGVLELMSISRQALVPAQKQRMCPSILKIAK